MGQFEIKFSVARPVFFPRNPNEGWKVVRGIITNVLVGSFFSGVYEEINYPVVDLALVLKTSNKWTNVLESSSTYYFRSLVL